MADVEPLSAALRQAAMASGVWPLAAWARPSWYIARRDDFAATPQYLMAVAMSAAATSFTPLTSAGLSGSEGSAARRSHSTRSAGCACARKGDRTDNKTENMAAVATAAAATIARVGNRLLMRLRLRRSLGKFKTPDGANAISAPDPGWRSASAERSPIARSSRPPEHRTRCYQR